ncbi:TRAP transporter substrate-binding protein DctP [Thermodesulfobacteriota bacterium]
MRKLLTAIVILVFVCGIALVGVLPASAGKPIVLKAVSFKPKPQMMAGNLGMLMERVKAKSKGELMIEYKGGPETMNPFGQAPAVRKGVVDMCWVPSSFYASLMPWGEVLVASQITAWEERERGAYDFVNNGHKKAGLFYLGRTTPSEGTGDFYILTKKETRSFGDLAGQKIGSLGPLAIPIAKAMGGTPLVVKVMDIYTSLEQGIMDANFSTMQTHADLHLWETAKYIIDEPFFCSPSVTIMNLKKWNSLPGHLQKALMEAQKEVEREYAPINTRLLKEAAGKLKKGGVKFIKFSPSDSKKYINTIYDSFWANILKKNPDAAPARKMLSK